MPLTIFLKQYGQSFSDAFIKAASPKIPSIIPIAASESFPNVSIYTGNHVNLFLANYYYYTMVVKLLFLGAGASSKFDIPTMQGMVTKFEEETKKENPPELQLYSKIKKIQESAYGYGHIDIESIFSVIQGIAKETKLKEMGHLPFYYISNQNLKKEFTSDEIKNAQKLQTRLEDFIKKECVSPLSIEEKNDVYQNSYHALFSCMPGKNNKYGDNNYAIEWRAYTTNYDSIFEDFWADYLKLRDYFTNDENSKHEVLSTTSPPNSDALSLIKLHGSIDWVKEKSGKILRMGSTRFTRLKLKGEVMVFPIQQKDLYLHPWITLFQDLKKGLKEFNEWIVIGYAFNDEFIFEIFKESFSRDKKLVIINSSGDRIKDKFSKEKHDQIVVLPIKFGNKYFPSQIEDYFEGVRTLNVKVKTTSPYIGFYSSFEIQELKIISPEEFVTSNVGNLVVSGGFSHKDDEEIICQIKIKHSLPSKDELVLQFASESEYNYEMTVYHDDRYLTSDKGTTTRDDRWHENTFTGSEVKIHHSNLFI